MMDAPVRRLESRWIYQGRIARLREDRVLLPRGTETTYEYVEIKHGSSVLAMEDNGDVWLVREWKYAIGRESLEVVSGGIEPDEDALTTAKRELQEEAGVTASEWIELGWVDPFTTMLRCPNYLFLARGLNHVGHEHEEGEIMQLIRMPFNQAFDLAVNGTITHATSCAVIFRAAEWLKRR
jgi:ADP-ribose pyrophosphatase